VGTFEGVPTTLTSPEIHDLSEIRVNESFACARRTIDAARVCWGLNDRSEIGTGSLGGTISTPTAFDVGTIAAMSSAFLHSCAVTTSGGIVCWGWDSNLECGQVTMPVVTPTPVSDQAGPLTGCTAVVSAVDHSCAVCGGRPVCWGENGHGELGRGMMTTATAIADAPVVPAGAYVEVSACDSGACALRDDGHLYCWGAAEYGQVGDGSHAVNLPTPVVAPL
jgi:alpha-tubulin suppressor-like RCC1 family protein